MDTLLPEGHVARPVGDGPFGVVMERTPYLRTDPVAGQFWAARYIYVKQDVRGRGGSGGVLDMNAMQEQDGYDAVEWAATLPGSNVRTRRDMEGILLQETADPAAVRR